MSWPIDDALFRALRHRKRSAEWPSHDWDEIEAGAAEEWWPAFEGLVREIRSRGMDRSLHGVLSIGGLKLSIGGEAGIDDSYLVISRSIEISGHYTFTYRNSHPDPRKDWTATYPPEQVIPAFYRFVTRAGWFPEGHPMLVGMETGVPYGQS